MTWTFWVAIVVVIATVYALIKRYETRLVLLTSGFVMAFISLQPMIAFKQFDKSMTNGSLIIAIIAALVFGVDPARMLGQLEQGQVQTDPAPFGIVESTALFKGSANSSVEITRLVLDQARRLKDLEQENARLKRVVADLSLDNLILKEVSTGKF